MKDVVDVIKTAVLTAPPQSWPTFDGGTLSRSQYITASEASKCERALCIEKMMMQVREGDEPEETAPDLNASGPQGIFARGHAIEAWAVEQIRVMLEHPEEQLLFAGKEQVSFYSDKARVSGTPDGVYVSTVEGHEELTLMEFKSTAYPVTAPKAAHIEQVRVNMGLIRFLAKVHGGLEFCKLLKLNPADLLDDNGKLKPWTCGRLIYIDSSDYFQMSTFEVDYDDAEAFKNATRKAKRIFAPDGSVHLDPREAEPEGLEKGGCHFCSVRKICKSWLEEDGDSRASKLADRAAPPPLAKLPKADTPQAFMDAVDEFLSLRDEVADLSAAADKLDKEVVRPYMIEHEPAVVVEHYGEDFKLTLNWQTRTSFDKKAAKADGVAVEKYEKEGKPFSVLRVSQIKERD